MEFYDNQKDPIKYYFLEKIQGTLASRGSLKLLIKKQRSPNEANYSAHGYYNRMNQSEMMNLSQSQSFENVKYQEEEEEDDDYEAETNRKTRNKNPIQGRTERVHYSNL